MRALRSLLLACTLMLSNTAHAGKITIAAASDLKFAMSEIVDAFVQAHPGEQLEVVYGSSGKFQTQIQQGAPYDLYFSADIAFAHELAKRGFAASPVRSYAYGRIVLWSTSLPAEKMALANLTDPAIKRIAIANPKHAPYGQRAEEALRAAGLWQQVQARIVYGDNIAHTAQFVQTGNAQIGIIALALALNPELARQGGHALIPEALHAPLEQGYLITKRAADNPLARQFADYMNHPAARAVMQRYGFLLPAAAANGKLPGEDARRQ